MTYAVEYDPETAEYVATAGDACYVSDCAALAYGWLAAQIADDDTTEVPTQ